MCVRSNRYSIVQTIEKGQSKALMYKQKCKAWECPTCGKRKAYLVGKRATENFEADNTRFLTLTMRPIDDKEKAMRDIKKAWNRLRTYITRKFGKTKYVWTLEFQERTEMPHLHILLDRYIPAAWLNVWVERSGFGPIYKIEKVKSESVFGYIVKYINKGLGSEKMARILKSMRGRRVGFSRGMTLEDTQKTNWTKLAEVPFGCSVDYVAEQLSKMQKGKGRGQLVISRGTDSIEVTSNIVNYTDKDVYFDEQFRLATSFVRKMSKSWDPHIKEQRIRKYEHLFRKQIVSPALLMLSTALTPPSIHSQGAQLRA